MKMHTKLVVLFLIITVFALTGCSTHKTVVEPIVKEEGAQGFLWKIENNTNTVYLLGSIHVGKESMYPLRKTILNAFEKADALYIEVDYSKELSDVDKTKMAQLMLLQDGKTLKDILPSELYQMVDEKSKALGYSMDELSVYRPDVIGTFITSAMSQDLIQEYDYAIDKHLGLKAKEMGKTIVEIDSMVDLANIQDSFSIGLQNYLLETAIKMSAADLKKSFDDNIEYWMNGDEERIIASETGQLEEQQDLYKEYLDKIVKKRNVHVAEVVESLLKDNDGKTYFVVYGAAHFLLEDNIISLLKQKGYDVIKQ